MATFNYYLRAPRAKKETPIVLFISDDGVTTKISTGERIDPKFWDFNKQTVKKSYTGSPELNQFLTAFKLKAQNTYRNKAIEGVRPGSTSLREEIELPKRKSNTEFYFHLTNFIEEGKNTKQFSTIQKFKSLQNHLIEFQEKRRKYITFETVDLDFFESFSKFLIDVKKQNNNTLSKYIKSLKTFMLWSYDRKAHENLQFKKFKAPEYDVDIVYLTEAELLKLSNHNFDNPTFDKVRDAFCFGCFTGQRFSDIYNITWNDIKGRSWFLHTKKTKDIIEVPLSVYALKIIEKYKARERPVMAFSNQKMNDTIKEIAKILEFNEPIRMTSYSGSTRTDTVEPKHKLISTHTARRTFVTLSLEKGMRPETVMSLTGHKDYKTFKRYIKISSKVKELELNSVWK